ncbi:hypothetical protein CAPN010_12900 [Capnocytophaga cynodegmi]|uniref:hypothetical protein n=1 Tax=Capnocytophaga cynodegmi TaxID=28189 RepID=UPI001EE1A3E5|nr:hypothetical protein [Capnocytophaga cynodegmi]GJQ07132.1 hypothetical protein CAPN010_12900 [Capnocytophaga cynodegmi]
MDNFIQIIFAFIVAWLSKPLLKIILDQVTVLRNYLYIELSFRKYNYGINVNILFVAAIIIFGIFIPKQVDFENKIERYKTEIAVYKEGTKSTPELLTEAGKVIELEKQIKVSEFINFSWQFLLYILILFLGVRLAFSTIINDNLSKFERDLKILKPTISEEDYNLLESLWAQMKNQENFNEIRDKMKELKKMK